MDDWESGADFLDANIGEYEVDSEDIEPQEWVKQVGSSFDYVIPFDCLARDIQLWIMSTSVRLQPAISFASAMTIMSCVYGRQLNCGGIKGNMMFLSLAESGEGKDWNLKAIDKVLDSAGMGIRVCGQMASGAALVDTVHDNPASALLIDEAGHYFKAINGKGANIHAAEIMPIITELYTSSSSFYREKARKGQEGRKIIEPNLAVMAVSTEGQIFEALRSSEVADGSLCRFMVFFGESDVKRQKSKKSQNEVPGEIVSRIEREKTMFFSKSDELTLTDEYIEAKDLILDLFDELAIEVSENQSKRMFKPFYKRIGVQAVQLAMLIDGCKSVEVLNWCADLAKQSLETFIKKYNHLASDSDQERLFKIVERCIKESGTKGINLNGMYSATRAIAPYMKKQILQEMVESGKVFTRKQRQGDSRQQSLVYFWKK